MSCETCWQPTQVACTQQVGTQATTQATAVIARGERCLGLSNCCGSLAACSGRSVFRAQWAALLVQCGAALELQLLRGCTLHKAWLGHRRCRHLRYRQPRPPFKQPSFIIVSYTAAQLLPPPTHYRGLEARAATVLEVAQPGPAQLSQRWHADARARASAAVDQALDNWEALSAQGSSSSSQAGGRSSTNSSEAGGVSPPQQ